MASKRQRVQTATESKSAAFPFFTELPRQVTSHVLSFAPGAIFTTRSTASQAPQVGRSVHESRCYSKSPHPVEFRYGRNRDRIHWICPNHPFLPPWPLREVGSLRPPHPVTLDNPAPARWPQFPNGAFLAHGCCLPASLQSVSDLEAMLTFVQNHVNRFRVAERSFMFEEEPAEEEGQEGPAYQVALLIYHNPPHTPFSSERPVEVKASAKTLPPTGMPRFHNAANPWIALPGMDVYDRVQRKYLTGFKYGPRNWSMPAQIFTIPDFAQVLHRELQQGQIQHIAVVLLVQTDAAEDEDESAAWPLAIYTWNSETGILDAAEPGAASEEAMQWDIAKHSPHERVEQDFRAAKLANPARAYDITNSYNDFRRRYHYTA